MNHNKPWNKLTSTEFTSTCSKWQSNKSFHMDNTWQYTPGARAWGQPWWQEQTLCLSLHCQDSLAFQKLTSNECTLRECGYDSLGHSKNPYNVDVMSVHWCVCHVANCIHLSSVNGKKIKISWSISNTTQAKFSRPALLLFDHPEAWKHGDVIFMDFQQNEKSSKSSYRFQSPFQFFLLQNPSESQQPISARLEILSKYGWTCATKTKMRGCARGKLGRVKL